MNREKGRGKYIIHSSGPAWRGGHHHERELLRQCYDKSLQLALEQGCKSIAFPLMATGMFRFPKEIGMQIAIDVFTDFLMEHEMDITLVVFRKELYHISGRWFYDVKRYIDDEYVDQKLAEEYRRGRVRRKEEDTSFSTSYLTSEAPPKMDRDEVFGGEDGFLLSECEEREDESDESEFERTECAMRSAPLESCATVLDECNWSDEIDRDYKKRGKR